jgi:hypothetical protein
VAPRNRQRLMRDRDLPLIQSSISADVFHLFLSSQSSVSPSSVNPSVLKVIVAQSGREICIYHIECQRVSLAQYRWTFNQLRKLFRLTVTWRKFVLNISIYYLRIRLEKAEENHEKLQ